MFNPFQDVNWRPDRAEVRDFGRVLAIGFASIGIMLALVVRWKSGQWAQWPLWLGGIGAVIGSICWAAPAIARPIYVAWHAIGGLVGFCISNALLIVVFYLVLTPIGLVMHLLGRDPLERQWDREATTYWKDAEKPSDARSYFRQF